MVIKDIRCHGRTHLNPQILYATCLCTKTLFVVNCRHVQRCGRCRRVSFNTKTHNRLASSLASSFENRRRQVSIFPLQLHLQTSHLLSETHLVHSFTSEPRNVQRTIQCEASALSFRNTFTRRCFFTHAHTLSHTNAFTHRRFYTQTLVQKRKRPSQFFLSF